MRINLLLAALALALGSFGHRPAEADPVTIVCGAVPATLPLCREGAEAWGRARGQEVRVLAYPDSTTQSRALVRELLEAGVEGLDVLEIDIVWPSMLAPDLVDLGTQIQEQPQSFFASAVRSFTVEDRLVAIPWYLSVGRLLYRTDLLAKYGLAVPRTWEELATSARLVQDGERAAGAGDLWGFVCQARVGEGLTVNALEWLASAGAPPLLAADGTLLPDDPRVVAVFSQAVSWVGTIAPATVLDMGGSESLAAFLQGQAVFLRHWSNGLQLAEGTAPAVQGNIGTAALPAGNGSDGRSAAVLGGFGLAVSRHSRQPELAADLVRWLTSAEEQRRRALQGGLDPSRPALYDDPELRAARPDYAELRTALESAIVRPATAASGNYEALSRTFAEGVHRILAREIEPAPGVAELAAALRRVGPSLPRAGS